MARINITLDQDEVLRLLEENGSEAFKTLLQETLNSILRAESAQQLNAEPYERSPERLDCRNGVRQRTLVTRIGTIELAVPRHRKAPFRTVVFENYRRSEAALITTMAEMVVGGTSTAKVGRVMETLCGTGFSKQSVSEACKELDEAVAAFQNRPIEGPRLFLMADATYLKVRENHRVVSKALLVAMGFRPDGTKDILGFAVADSESEESWKAFFESLKERGLCGLRMMTSDACEGLIAAFRSVFPDVAWQRCQAHFARNVSDAAPKHLRAGLKSELTAMFNAKTIEEARALRDEIFSDYSEVAPKSVERLDTGFDDAMTVMELPEQMRRSTRTSNYLERLNGEIKRRANVIRVFPNAGSVVRLMGAVLMEEDSRWATMKKIYYKVACEELEKKAPILAEIARLQARMLEAA